MSPPGAAKAAPYGRLHDDCPYDCAVGDKRSLFIPLVRNRTGIVKQHDGTGFWRLRIRSQPGIPRRTCELRFENQRYLHCRTSEAGYVRNRYPQHVRQVRTHYRKRPLQSFADLPYCRRWRLSPFDFC